MASLVMFLGTKYVLHSWTALIGPSAAAKMDPLGRSKNAVFVPRNTTKLTTRGSTSPDGVEMTHQREEIYTPSGDEANSIRLLGLLAV